VAERHFVSCLGNSCHCPSIGLIVGVNIIVVAVIVIVAVVVVVFISRRLRSHYTDVNSANNINSCSSQLYSELQAASSDGRRIYSQLQNAGADTPAEAPTHDDLYENTTWRFSTTCTNSVRLRKKTIVRFNVVRDRLCCRQ